MLVGLPTGAGPRCDRGGSRGPRIPGAGQPPNRSMSSPFACRAMRIIGTGCQTVLPSLPMTKRRSKVGLAGWIAGGLGAETSWPCETWESRQQFDGQEGMEDASEREIHLTGTRRAGTTVAIARADDERAVRR